MFQNSTYITPSPTYSLIIRTYSLTAYNNVDMRNDCMLAIVDILYKHIPFSNPNAKRTFDSDLSTIGNYIQKTTLKSKDLTLFRAFRHNKVIFAVYSKNTQALRLPLYKCAQNSTRMSALCESKIPIHDIYKMCGYDNSQYFNRVFKNMKEVTPNQFRQQSRAIKMWKY